MRAARSSPPSERQSTRPTMSGVAPWRVDFVRSVGRRVFAGSQSRLPRGRRWPAGTARGTGARRRWVSRARGGAAYPPAGPQWAAARPGRRPSDRRTRVHRTQRNARPGSGEAAGRARAIGRRSQRRSGVPPAVRKAGKQASGQHACPSPTERASYTPIGRPASMRNAIGGLLGSQEGAHDSVACPWMCSRLGRDHSRLASELDNLRRRRLHAGHRVLHRLGGAAFAVPVIVAWLNLIGFAHHVWLSFASHSRGRERAE